MTIALPWLNCLLLISIRLGTVLLLTPVQAIRQLPIPTRLLLVFIFSLLLSLDVSATEIMDTVRIIAGGLSEFANGLIMAASMYAAFSVFQIAGQLIDNETGLNAVAIFNPGEHSQEALTSHLLSMLAVLFFFAMNGHLWLFKGLSYSFVIIPPGTIAIFSGFTPVISQFGFMFSMAFMIASPIILALLAIDLCGALITRNIPQINTYFLTLPLKILMGLFLLYLMMNYISPASNVVFEHCFNTWKEFLS
jgi:flagellar biosynthesis protein FliR